MDFRLSDRAETFRAEVREFLDEHLTDELRERVHRTGTDHDWGFHRALAERGWIAAGWPEELGGQGRDPFEMAAFTEEAALAGAPLILLGTTLLVANTLRHIGTERQKRELIPAILSGELCVCLGYSEPDAGSDVAAVTTRAERDGDEWVITGQKMFTTMAHEAQYVFLLTRTSPDAPRHQGLTMFLVPLDRPGVEVHPVATLGGERTNVTYYNGVRVPDSARVGEVDGGWSVLMVALTFERTGRVAGELRRLLEQARAGTERATGDGRRPLDDASVRTRLARTAVDGEVARLLAHRMSWVAAQGELPSIEGSMAKLFATEAFQAAAADLLDLTGSSGLVTDPAPGARLTAEHAYRHAAVVTIYGGSSEIQRNIIARRALALPAGAPR